MRTQINYGTWIDPPSTPLFNGLWAKVYFLTLMHQGQSPSALSRLKENGRLSSPGNGPQKETKKEMRGQQLSWRTGQGLNHPASADAVWPVKDPIWLAMESIPNTHVQ